ncbi:ATP-binding protein [Nocardia sp. NPDC060220]|uniref:ATP-binding protein n=1 Tax=Nocardia sp. NPDC060220 TaxID=3347076 RepID=UPI00364D086A
MLEAAMSRDPSDRPTAEILGEQLQQIERDHGFAVDEMSLYTEPGAVRTPFPAPTAAPASETGNLPLELSSFVGRRIEIETVENLLAASRLVSLTGTGGVGKSRLALQVAHEITRDQADGVWLIELADLRDPALLVEVVATALGVRNRGTEPTSELLTRWLAPRELLMVLDNCEHIIDAVAKLTESLLRTCRRLRVLTTSRETLGLGGESVFVVPPLALSGQGEQPDPATHLGDAETLFAERAAAAMPKFEVTEHNRDHVAQICTRLDGLPLAIELAAARLRTMSPAQIVSKLDDPLTLLTRGTRGVPKRQQTLRWCIGWSFELCTTLERRLWSQLSVFAGGFELDAAAQVCEPDLTESELDDAIAVLVDKSILVADQQDGTIRFRMLETVREYGRQQDEDPQTAPRHRQWCVQLAQQAERDWISSRQSWWVARLERELPNLRQALEFSLSTADPSAIRIATALYLFWSRSGRFGEGRRWLEHALDRADTASTTDRAKALYMARVLAAAQNDLPAAADRMTQLAALNRRSGDPLVAAIASLAEVNHTIAGVGGSMAQASVLLADSVDALAKCGEPGLYLDAQISLGWSYAFQGEITQALSCLRSALAITESAGETDIRSWALWAAGFATWRGSDPARAIELLEAGIRSAQQAADVLVAAGCSEMLAWIATDRNQFRRAATLMGAADTLSSSVGSSVFIFHGLRAFHDRSAQRSRDALGSEEFQAAVSEGTSMDFATAVAFALS